MFDYLSEYLLLQGKRRRKEGTYARARQLQSQGYAYIFNTLASEFCSVFKWKSTDELGSIATELIERTILYSGACAFFQFTTGQGLYSETSWRCGVPSGFDNLSFYGHPTTCQITDYAGHSLGKFLPVLREETSPAIANCALIYDNADSYSPIGLVLYFAERLSVLSTAIDAAIRNIHGTTIIHCTHEQAMSLERQRRAAEAGTPFVFEYSDYDSNSMRTELLTTPGAADNLKVLMETYDKIHADFLQRIGVRANNEMNKKSGITPMEIIENRQNVDLMLNKRLEARKVGIEMCERIGLTGLQVTLDNFENLIGDYDKQGNRILPDDRDGDGVINEGTPEERVVGNG